MKECEEIAAELNIVNELKDESIKSQHFKQIVKDAIVDKNEKVLRLEIKRYSKLDWDDEMYERKDYLKELTFEGARTKFRIRSNMSKFAFNYRNKKEYSDNCWRCIGCDEAIDTFAHVKWCVAYEDLRVGIDLTSDKDLVWYVSEVFKRRDKK